MRTMLSTLGQAMAGYAQRVLEPIARRTGIHLSETSGRWRLFIVLSSVLVCWFALRVCYRIVAVPDIGLRCAFTTRVNRIFSEFVYGEPTIAPDQLVGNHITRIGDHPVDNWPQFLRVLNNIRDEKATPLESSDDLVASPSTHVKIGEEELVRIELQHPNHGTITVLWCRLERSPLEVLLPSILWFFLRGGMFLVAAFVFWKRPLDRSVRMFFLLSWITTGAFVGGFHWWRLVTEPLLCSLLIVCCIALPAVSLHFYLIFPRPKQFVQTYPRLAILGLYLLPAVFTSLILFGYLRARWLFRGGSPRSSLAGIVGALSDAFHEVAGAESGLNSAMGLVLGSIYWCLILAAFYYLACLVCMLHSYWTATDSTERNQVKWILTGSVLATLPIGYTLFLAFNQPNAFGGGAASWPMFLASLIVTTTYTISITRYRLMQLDQIINSSMVYFAISFSAGLLYYGVVFVGTLLFSSWIARPSLGQALSVSSTSLILLVVLDWIRSRVKRELNRRFHREQFQLDRTLRRMSLAVSQLVDPPAMARRLLQTSTELLGITRGAVYLREGSEPFYRMVDGVGEPPALNELSSGCPLIEALLTQGTITVAGSFQAPEPAQRQLAFLKGEVALAISHENQMLAFLILGAKELGSYTPEDLSLLTAFGQVTALALVSTRGHSRIEALNQELQEKLAKIAEQQRSILALQSLLRQGGQPAPVEPEPTATELPAASEDSETVVGSSAKIQHLLQLVRKVSPSQSAVLLRGESGTGKGLLARALHDAGTRNQRVFVKVHCAALSQTLLESELFGHVKGAFTGAHRDKIGRFELADGGTLFLDEIGDINLDVQTKLLRVIQEMTFERVGSNTPVQVDVRIIAATHQNLEKLIREGRFREDLYYRLNVISLHVPPLRERIEDIPELASHFLQAHSRKTGKLVDRIDDDAMCILKGFHWPGNIRQLENILERAVVIADERTIHIRDLAPELLENAELPGASTESVPERTPELVAATSISPQPDSLAERNRLERERLVRALAVANGNKAEASRALGLARSTFFSKLKKHGLN